MNTLISVAAGRAKIIYSALAVHRYLIKRMKSDAGISAQNAGNTDVPRTLQSVASVYDFDDRIIAPANGFDGAEDYYKKCSAKLFIDGIRVPTLLIHAASDPWIPLTMYLERTWPGDGSVSLVVSCDGGHVGFHGRDLATPWHNACISAFFKSKVGGSGEPPT